MIVAAVVLVVVSTVVVLRGGNPEATASHADEPEDTTSERFYRGADRPAGSDADGKPGDGVHF